MEKMLRLMLQSGLYYKKFFKTKKPRLINESGFKSRAGYNGARTVLHFLKRFALDSFSILNIGSDKMIFVILIMQDRN